MGKFKRKRSTRKPQVSNHNLCLRSNEKGNEIKKKLKTFIDEGVSNSEVEFPSLDFMFESAYSSESSAPSKSTNELYEESVSLTKRIKLEESSWKETTDKVTSLKAATVSSNEYYESSPISSNMDDDEIVKLKFYCEESTLQFFNTQDITVEECGYDKYGDLTVFEKDLLSFIPVELENALSTVLTSCHVNHITDFQSFIKFICCTICINEDQDCVDACANLLKQVLETHQDVQKVKFTSAEIFMLLFNYGINISTCQLLQMKPEIKHHLTNAKVGHYSKNQIPSNWIYNLQVTLSLLPDLLYVCEFNKEILNDVVLFLLWLSLDYSVREEHICSLIRECIEVCLENIEEKDWSGSYFSLIKNVIAFSFSSAYTKWNSVCWMIKMIPVLSKRGLQLQSLMAYAALKCCIAEDSEVDMMEIGDKKVVTVSKIQSIMKIISEMEDSTTLVFAVKFLDICIKHLMFESKAEYAKFCTSLKLCEGAINEKTYSAKSHFLRIYSKLKVMLDMSISSKF